MKDSDVSKRRVFWFALAALCLSASGFIFAGRTMLSDSLGDGAYRVLIIAAYVLLAGVAGSLTKGFAAAESPAE